MYPDVAISRWLAALVPLVITAQFALVGTGVIRDEAAVKAMSRTGDPRAEGGGQYDAEVTWPVLSVEVQTLR